MTLPLAVTLKVAGGPWTRSVLKYPLDTYPGSCISEYGVQGEAAVET